MADIDTLSIGIEANVDGAAGAIDTLVRKLSSLNESLASFGKSDVLSGMRGVASSFRDISSAMKGVDDTKLEKVSKSISALAKVGSKSTGSGKAFKEISQGADNADKAISKIAKEFVKDNWLNVGRNGLNAIKESLSGIANGGDLSESLVGVKNAIETYAKFNDQLDETRETFLETIRAMRRKGDKLYVSPGVKSDLSDDYAQISKELGILTQNRKARFSAFSAEDEIPRLFSQPDEQSYIRSFSDKNEVDLTGLIGAWRDARDSALSYNKAINMGLDRTGEMETMEGMLQNLVGTLKDAGIYTQSFADGMKAVKDALNGANLSAASMDVAKFLDAKMGDAKSGNTDEAWWDSTMKEASGIANSYKGTEYESEAQEKVIDALKKLQDAARGANKAVEEVNQAVQETPKNTVFEEIATNLKTLQGVEIPDFSNLKSLTTFMNSLTNALSGGVVGGLTSFKNAIIELKSVGEVNIPGLIETINAIAQLGGQTLSTAADNMFLIKNALSGLSGAEILPVQGLNDLITSFNEFASGTVTTAAANLKTLASAIQQFTVGINFQGLSGFGGFVSGLEKLTTIDVQGASEAMRTLVENVSKMNDIRIPDFSNLKPLSQMLRNTASLIRANTAEAKANAPAVKEMVNSFSLLNSVGKVTGGVISRITEGFKGIKNPISSILNGIKMFPRTLSRIYVAARSLRWAIDLLSKPIDIASQLTEVQNVVDTAFGKYASKVEDLSKNSINNFGINELQVKKSAGVFQAMANAMGLAKDSASDMSVELVKLSADIASFYETDYEKVAEDMQSIYTGMSRPLRKYGVDLSQATLQEYANAQGIQKKISAMTQAEKTMLRYQYVLERTTDAQGDFARTSNSWANQIRILKQNIQDLGSKIGTGLINFLKPAVQAFNKAFNQIIAIAEKALNAIGKLLGWQVQISQVGVLDDAADAAEGYGDAMDDAAGGAKKAADEQEKLNENLAKFDKLNVITTPKEDNGSGGGGGGGGAGGGGSGKAKATGGEVTFKPYESDVDSWLDFGDRINRALKDFLEKIPWGEIQTKARQFGHTMASIINGFNQDSETFYLLGKTFAEGINTIAHALDAFFEHINTYKAGYNLGMIINGLFENIDWSTIHHLAENMGDKLADAINSAFRKTNWHAVGDGLAEALNSAVIIALRSGSKIDFKMIGRSLATAFNSFFEKFNWADCGSAINKWIVGLLDAIISFITKANWQKVGESIGDMLAKINFAQIMQKVAVALWKALNAAIETWSNMFSVAPFETAVLSIVGVTKLLSIAPFQAFTSGLGTFIAELNGGSTAINAFVAGFPTIGGVISGLSDVLFAARVGIANFGAAFSESGNIISGVFNGLEAAGTAFFTSFSKGTEMLLRVISGVVVGIAEFSIVSDLFHDAYLGTVELEAGLAKLVITLTAVAAAFTLITGSTGIGLLITAGIGAVAAIKGISEAANELAELEAWNAIGRVLSEPGGIPLQELSQQYQDALFGIQKGFDQISIAAEGLDNSYQKVDQLKAQVEGYSMAIQNAGTTTDSNAKSMANSLQMLLNETIRIMQQEYQVIVMTVNEAIKAGDKSVQESAPSFLAAVTGIDEAMLEHYNKASERMKALNELYSTGQIGATEYQQAQAAIYKDLGESTGEIGKVTNAIDKLNKKGDELNLENYTYQLNGVTEVDTDAMIADLEAFFSVLDETNKVIDDSNTTFTDLTNKRKEEAKRWGMTEELADLEKGQAAMDGFFESSTEKTRQDAEKFINTIQEGYINKLQNIYTENGAGEEGARAAKQYVETVINPIGETLRTKCEELDMDIPVYMDGISADIVDGLRKSVPVTMTATGGYITKMIDVPFDTAFTEAEQKYPERAHALSTLTVDEAVSGMEEGEGQMLSATEKLVLSSLDKMSQKGEEAGQSSYESGYGLSSQYTSGVTDGTNDGQAEIAAAQQRTTDQINAGAESQGQAQYQAQYKAATQGTAGYTAGSEEGRSEIESQNKQTADVITDIGDLENQVYSSYQTVGERGAQGILDTSPKGASAARDWLSNVANAFRTDMTATTAAYSQGKKIVEEAGRGIEESGNALGQSLAAAEQTAISTAGETITSGLEQWIDEWNSRMQSWWNENVEPFFETGRWSDLAENFREAVIDALEDMISDWDSGMDDWLNTTESYFDSGTWDGMLQAIPEAFRNAFEEALSAVSEVMNKMTEQVGQALDDITRQISEVGEAVDKAKSGTTTKKTGNTSSKGKKVYATGGFPTTGQMFYAREAGPELVGTIGNKTAVMNNDQIVSAVSQGVAAAVASVIGGGMGNETELTVNLDGREVYRSVVRHDRQFKQSTGKSAFAY